MIKSKRYRLVTASPSKNRDKQSDNRLCLSRVDRFKIPGLFLSKSKRSRKRSTRLTPKQKARSTRLTLSRRQGPQEEGKAH